MKIEPKTCVKCGEHYFGDACVGCHSNQYAHYDLDASTRSKVIKGFVILVIIGIFGLILMQK